MKKMILATAALLLLAPVDAQQPQTGATTQTSEWLTSFDEVEVHAPVDITFVCVPLSEAPKIVYDTHGSYTSKFKAAVKDKVLRITERAEARRADRTTVTVYHNGLRRIDLSGAEANFTDTLRAPLLDLAVGGEAVMRATLDVKDLRAELTGKSRATLDGAARYLWLYVSTGVFDAEGLEAMSVQVNAAGAGEARVWATDRFEAKTSTNARIFYRGDPSIVRGGAKFMGGDITRIEGK